MRHVRRRAVLIASAIVVGALTAATWRAIQVLTIGVAYKAKMLCSGVFVSGRTSDVVLTELQTDDLAALRYIRATVDTAARSVTASGFGVVRRTAIYREGLGCALALDGLVPPRMPTGGPEVADGSSIGAHAAPLQVRSAALDGVMSRAFSEPDPRRRRQTLAVVMMQDGRSSTSDMPPESRQRQRCPGGRSPRVS